MQREAGTEYFLNKRRYKQNKERECAAYIQK